MTTQKHHIPWYLWPFAAIWKLLAVIVEMTGRFVAMVLGVVLLDALRQRALDPVLVAGVGVYDVPLLCHGSSPGVRVAARLDLSHPG